MRVGSTRPVFKTASFYLFKLGVQNGAFWPPIKVKKFQKKIICKAEGEKKEKGERRGEPGAISGEGGGHRTTTGGSPAPAPATARGGRKGKIFYFFAISFL